MPQPFIVESVTTFVRGERSFPNLSVLDLSCGEGELLVTFKELGSLLLAPAFPADRFITALSSISNFTLRPTMACFHSANSIHIVLSRIRNAAATAVTATAVTATAVTAVDSGESKRRVVITPAASTRRRRPH